MVEDFETLCQAHFPELGQLWVDYQEREGCSHMVHMTSMFKLETD